MEDVATPSRCIAGAEKRARFDENFCSEADILKLLKDLGSDSSDECCSSDDDDEGRIPVFGFEVNKEGNAGYFLRTPDQDNHEVSQDKPILGSEISLVEQHAPKPAAPVNVEAPPAVLTASNGDRVRSQNPSFSIQPTRFVGNPGLKVNPPEQTPYGFFQLLFTEDFFKLLVEKSNDYAEQILLMMACPQSIINGWEDITIEEMKTFMGLIFFQGLVQLRRYEDYWSRHHLLQTSVPQFMSRDRFLLIMQCLNFEIQNERSQPISKIRSLVDYFNARMETVWEAARNLSINESMVGWRGHLSRRHKYGIKLYVLEEQSGLVHKIHVFGGCEHSKVSVLNHASKVVDILMDGKFGKGHSLYIGNIHNSVPLSESLLEKQLYTTRTLLPNRRCNPQNVVPKKLKKEETFSLYFQNNVCVAKKERKREVLAISTESGNRPVTVKNRRCQEKQKTEMITNNDGSMKGFNRHDLIYYSADHEAIRWYKKLGLHIFHMMLNNVFFMFKKFNTENTKIDLHDFQLQIASILLPQSPEQNNDSAPSLPTHIHLPSLLPVNPNNNRTQRKRCKVCMETMKFRKDSVYGCPSCPGFPGFCLDPCFRIFHEYS